MTRSKFKRSREPGGPAKNWRSPFKWLAVAIPLMAAVVPIIGAFEHWFDEGTTTVLASTPAEYGDVCSLSNAKQHEQERNQARFRVTFDHARDTDHARDAILLLTRQTITATSELQARIRALTPPGSLAGAQRVLDEDWTTNLEVWGRYRERLSQGIGSAAQLVEVTARVPHTLISSKSADARARLLLLGRSACMLDAEHPQPNADWSKALRNELASERSGTTFSVTPAAAAGGHEGALPVVESSHGISTPALPVPEAQPAQARLPEHGVATSGRVSAPADIESASPASGAQSTTTAP